MAKSKAKLGIEGKAPVYCCYEAGRDGFGIHRYLESEGIINTVLDPSSVEVDQRKRRQKTDKIDAGKMLRLQESRYYHGNQRYRIVSVPSRGQEAEMRVHREWERLVKERTGHINRIKSLMALHGVRSGNVLKIDISEVKDWEGQELSKELGEELQREQERLHQVVKHMNQIRAEQRRRTKEPETKADKIVERFVLLKGIGMHSAWILSKEYFGWREFKNRRQVGALAGLTGSPYNSGNSNREQGISKAGNRRIRSLMVELSWFWLRWQPQSELSKWYMKRFGQGGERMRRIGIVALARKLLVALWKYLEFGIVPDGAVFKRIN